MRIVIASRRAATRRAISLLLRIRLNAEVVGEAGELEDLIKLVNANHPSIVLLDETLVSKNLDEVLPSLRMLDPSPAVIVLANSEEMKKAAQDAGADKTVLIGGEPKELLMAIESVQVAREDI